MSIENCEDCPYFKEKETVEQNTGEPDFVKVCTLTDDCLAFEEKFFQKTKEVIQ
jgi:hypothetical protein